MRIFVTGATGFIGSRIVKELLADKYQVIGLTRSEAGVKSLKSIGAEAHFGTLEDLDSIQAGAEKADAVIHTAFDHDFSNFIKNCEKDRQVIETLGSVLKGSKRPLIITSGVGMGSLGNGQAATEDVFNLEVKHPRVASEMAGNKMLEEGVDVRVVRLPQVHNIEKQGLISPLISFYKDKGTAAYIDEGSNKWAATHVEDVATLYKLVLEKGEKGKRYNAVAEEGLLSRDVITVIGEIFNLPVISLPTEDAQEYFGWLVMFAGGKDFWASSEQTRKELDWNPTRPSLIEDLKQMNR